MEVARAINAIDRKLLLLKKELDEHVAAHKLLVNKSSLHKIRRRLDDLDSEIGWIVKKIAQHDVQFRRGEDL